MAFKFKVDPGGNLVTESTTQKVDTNKQPSRLNMRVDGTGNIIIPAMVEAGVGAVQKFKEIATPRHGTTLWQRIRDPITGVLRETEQTKNLPELSLDIEAFKKDPIGVIKTTAGLLIASDEEGRKEVLKKWNPDIDITKDQKGNEIVTMPDGEQAILNKPGFSKADAYRLLFDTALFLGGSLAAAPVKGAIKKGMAGGVAAAATEAGRQQVSQELGTEEKTDVGRIAITGLTGGLVEGIPAGFKAAKEAVRAKKLGVLSAETKGLTGAITEAKEASKETGVGLFPGQQTLSPSALRKQAALQKLDGSSQKALEAIRKQDKEIGTAVEDALGLIAPAETIDEAPKMVQEAAQKAVNRKLGVRQKASQKFYKKAFEDKSPVDLPNTWGKIDEIKAGVEPDSPTAKLMDRVEKLLNRQKPEDEIKAALGEDTKKGLADIQKRHNSKMEIDDMFKEFGDSGAQKTGKAKLVQVKEALLSDLKQANPHYDKARQIYSEASPEVNKIQKSFLGKISKIDPLDQEKLDPIVARIFKPRTTDTQVLQAKALIQKESPEAWNAITRRRFEDLLSKPGYDDPQKVYTALFANNAQKRQLFAALDGEAKRRMKYLEVSANRARSGRFTGTDTAPKMQDIKDIDRGPWSVVGGLFTPLESAKGFLSGLSTEQRRTVLADTVYNTKWDPDWKALRQLDPVSKAASSKYRTILTKAAKSVAVSQSPESPAATRKAIEILNSEE